MPASQVLTQHAVTLCCAGMDKACASSNTWGDVKLLFQPCFLSRFAEPAGSNSCACRPAWDESLWPPGRRAAGDNPRAQSVASSTEPQSTHIIGNMLYAVHQPFDSPGNPFSLKVIRKPTDTPIFDSRGHRCVTSTLQLLAHHSSYFGCICGIDIQAAGQQCSLGYA